MTTKTTTPQAAVITVTPKAAEKISEFMKQERDENDKPYVDNGLYLRVFVSGGGCAGLSYGMGFEEKPDEEGDDTIITAEHNGVRLLLDSNSLRYLKGANIDYIEDLMGTGFKINNPNVTKSCSCGHSFSSG